MSTSTARPVCPECAQGKTVNCTGAALDERTEEMVPCTTTVKNRCDACHRPLPADAGGLCGSCAADAWDRWFDRHDDIGPDE